MRKRYWFVVGFILVGLFQLGDDGAVEQAQRATAPSVTGREIGRVATSPVPSPVSAQPRENELSQSSAPPADLVPVEVEQVRFVTGNRVAFRSGPSTSLDVLDRFDTGREVLLIEQRGDWSNVRDSLTRRSGWMASRFLGKEQRAPETKARTERRQEDRPSAPDAVIIQRIIDASVASYPRSCACPYSTDRGGRRCGGRSAYSRPGGYAPICYPQDVTQAMIDAYRR